MIVSIGMPQDLLSKGPGVLRPSNPRISGWVVYWNKENSLEAALEFSKKLEEISVFAADFNEDQVLVYPAAIRALQELKQSEAVPRPRLLLSVVNDVKTSAGSVLKSANHIHTILSSSKKRAAHIDQLVQLSVETDGIEIDYESLFLKDRENFSLFIRDLSEKLHQQGKWLSVIVEPKTADVLKDKEGAMDWNALGRYADSIKIMAYLYHYPSGKPGPLAPPEWIGNIARFALTQIPPEKLSIVLTMQGCDWGKPGHGKALTYTKAMDLREKHQASLQRDPQTLSPYFTYTENDIDHQVWFEDAESLKEKVRRLQENGIQNIGLWYLGSGDPDFLKAIWGQISSIQN